jgi:large subunit ribosomal protein L25
MEEILLEVTSRNTLGKKCSGLRRQGVTPVHLFGHGVPSLALQCDTAELRHALSQAGRTKLISLAIDGSKSPVKVLTREAQMRHRSFLHVDFYQVNLAEKTSVEVPIVLVGEAPAARTKATTVLQNLAHLTVECLPEDIPDKIEVDLSVLKEVEQAIHVKDLVLGKGVATLDDPEQMIVKVSAVAEEKVEVKPVEEVEVVEGEEKAAEEGAEEEAGEGEKTEKSSKD